MNFYNPYYSIPTLNNSVTKVGLLSRLFGGSGLTFGKILTGTERALNFANQAIPLIKQVKPMIGNAKTVFKVMNEFKRSENPNSNIRNNNSNINNDIAIPANNNINNETINDNSKQNEYNSPTFFM